MASIPAMRGLIKRRVLVNYRVEPSSIEAILPPPFKLRLVQGRAMAGICLIRLERVRPARVPRASIGLASDNVAYRVAVEWTDPGTREIHQGVYIPRRDTSSALQRVFGGRIFPGEYHLSRFNVFDRAGRISIRVLSNDGTGDVAVDAHEVDVFPNSSIFSSLDVASRFFEEGSVGYSAVRRASHLDGLRLQTESWAIRPLALDNIRSTFFERFGTAPDKAVFDNALIMRDVPHEWHALPRLAALAQ